MMTLDTRFFSADDKTKYEDKEIKEAINDAIFERMNFGMGEFGELTKLGQKEMMDIFVKLVEKSKDKKETARRIANYIVETAVIENANVEIARMKKLDFTIPMKAYRGQFDLDSIKADVQHAFGNSNSCIRTMGQKKRNTRHDA